MATRKPYDAMAGKRTGGETRGSHLDEREKIKLPHGTAPVVHRRALRIYAENPFLDQAQAEAVVRLATLRMEFAELYATVKEQGRIVEDRFGQAKENPAYKLLLSTQHALVNQEKALSISTAARHTTISDQDRQTPAHENAVPAIVGAPKLKIA